MPEIVKGLAEKDAGALWSYQLASPGALTIKAVVQGVN